MGDFSRSSSIGSNSDADAASQHEAVDSLAREELLEQVYAGVFGQLCTVVYPGKVFSTVNFKRETERWGTAELREAQPYAGEIYPERADPDTSYGWNGWEPRRGDQGTVVHAWTTRGGEAHTTAWGREDVLLLHMSSSGDDGRPRFLPIEVKGVQAQHQLPLAVPAAEAHGEQQEEGGGAGATAAAAGDCAAVATVASAAAVASTVTGGTSGGGGSRGSGSSSNSDDDAA